jgi:hypothetical protein
LVQIHEASYELLKMRISGLIDKVKISFKVTLLSQGTLP